MARTILVTGSASGIGKATAQRLRDGGHRVIGVDLQKAEIMADLATEEGRQHAISEALALTGGALDAVIACAGLAGADARAMVAVNYFGTLAIVDGLRNALLDSEAPRVVIVSSSASILQTNGRLVEACLAGDEPGAFAAIEEGDQLTYASTKLALSRWIRRASPHPNWAGSGILLNAVAPGTVHTPITAPLFATAEGRALLAKATPLAVADYAQPDDIAPILAFLASPDCRYMVGQTIFVDGGVDVILRGETHI